MAKISQFELLAVIKRGWLLYRATLKITFWLAFAYGLVNQFISVYAQRLLTVVDQHLVIQRPALLALLLLIGIIVLTIMTALIMLLQNGVLFKGQIKTNPIHFSTRLPALLVASIIFYVIVITGYMLYILPGVIAALLFYFYLPAILLEHKRVFQSFAYSFQLVRRNVFGVLGLLMFNFLILTIPVLVTHIIFGDQASGSTFGLEEIIIVLVQALLLPLVVAMTLTAFYHLRELLNSSIPDKKSRAQ